MKRSGCLLPANVTNEEHQEEERVASWINHDQHCWDEVAVRLVVRPSSAEDVFQVSIPATQQDDVLIWPFTRDERVSEKFAYQRLRDRGRQTNEGKHDQGLW